MQFVFSTDICIMRSSEFNSTWSINFQIRQKNLTMSDRKWLFSTTLLIRDHSARFVSCLSTCDRSSSFDRDVCNYDFHLQRLIWVTSLITISIDRAYYRERCKPIALSRKVARLIISFMYRLRYD